MDSESDVMQVDTIGSVPVVPTTLESAVQSIIQHVDESVRTFIERQIRLHLGDDMLSTFMPDASSTCTQLLDFIDRRWISLFADSVADNFRHTASQLKSLLRAVHCDYTSDGLLVASSTSAMEIAQCAESLIMAISPSQAVTISVIRRAIPSIDTNNNNSSDSKQNVNSNQRNKTIAVNQHVAHNNNNNNNNSNNNNNKDEQTIVLDGSNIAWRFGNSKGFSLRGLLIAFKYFVGKGHSCVVIFLPEGRMDQLCRNDDKAAYDELDSMRGKETLVLIPGADYDDAYMCNYARSHSGIVVSNDLYRDVIYQASATGARQAEEWRRWLEVCRMSFTFRKDEFLPNPSFNWSKAKDVSRSLQHF